MNFMIDGEEEEKLKSWKEAIKKVFGEYGLFEYRFKPYGIGTKVVVWSDLAKTSIDLTDVSKF